MFCHNASLSDLSSKRQGQGQAGGMLKMCYDRLLFSSCGGTISDQLRASKPAELITARQGFTQS